jgi:predicted MFS family arabinose efflux permease
MNSPWRSAAALALAAAVSLGLARFSYALLLPPMRADLGWSYTTGGAMNTVNAAGYLLGALLAPRWLARHDARRLLLSGGGAAALLLALHGLVRSDIALALLRAATGTASAASFIAGGLLAARLAGAAGPQRAGAVLGIYYGGTGLGIMASAALVPLLVPTPPAWPAAWWALAGTAALATLCTAAGTRTLHATGAAAGAHEHFDWRSLGFGLAAYLCFGLGYIGYMTFIVTLLREQGVAPSAVTAFYLLLGAAVVASSWLWAGLLQRWRGGGVLALLNALLALATLLPVVTSAVPSAFASGLLFGAVFLQVVAATTALVRHNLPPAAWPAGITAFTIVFAAGQIVGPTLVGWVADGPGGLLRGLACSAVALGVGALLALAQRPLDPQRHQRAASATS